MARRKRYIDANVYDEAKRRLAHIMDTHDSWAVMFSGGKDSLVTLHLTREVMLARGDTDPVEVVFRDEELIQDEVINFVASYRELPWINMRWLTVPLASNKYVMGVSTPYVQWDNGRQWVRPKPAWGINLDPGDDRVFDQYSLDTWTAGFFTGKIAFLTGIRADESIMRFRASVNKLHENYVNAVKDPAAKAVSLCKPIFDWSEDDVFKYLNDSGTAYCELYDHKMWTGHQLRVSTPIHAEQAKRFDKLSATSPEFYDRVVAVFPEMLAHERYYHSMDKAAAQARYGQSIDGVRTWIEENILDEEMLALAMQRFNSVAVRAARDPEKHTPAYLLRQFMSGAFKREILPDATRRRDAHA